MEKWIILFVRTKVGDCVGKGDQQLGGLEGVSRSCNDGF